MSSRVLYTHPLSGHCHRVELLLSLLDLPHDKVPVDIVNGEHRRPAFLAKNPFGQVPVLDDGSVTLAESTAILRYLVRRYAEGSSWYPRDAKQAAEVDRWLGVAAGPLAQGPARARVIALFGLPDDPEPARAMARTLFSTLDRHLEGQRWLAGEATTIADVALYAYTAHAPEGGVSLGPFSNVRRWVDDVRRLPRFVPMAETATPALAAARGAEA